MLKSCGKNVSFYSFNCVAQVTAEIISRMQTMREAMLTSNALVDLMQICGVVVECLSLINIVGAITIDMKTRT